LSVDAKYFETMGLQLQEGREFKDHEGSDKQAVVVNDVLVKKIGWEKPIGQIFKIDSIQYEVVGVLKDFHNYSFDEEIKPIIFNVAKKESFRFLSMRVRSGSTIKTYKSLQQNWASVFPHTPFAGGLQEDVWGFYYQEISIYDLVWKILSTIAVSLAALGLYGLVRLNVAARTKEFSIRKILGAGLKNLAGNITKQYMVLFSVALVIGAPAGYYLAKLLIEFAYTYHMPITFSSVAIAVVILVSVVLITISTQIRKVLKANPVEGLKIE
jgi:putative ABC transport system permease protein